MTEAQIDEAIEQILRSKELKATLGITNKVAYDVRNRYKRMAKLDILFKAGKLKIIT